MGTRKQPSIALQGVLQALEGSDCRSKSGEYVFVVCGIKLNLICHLMCWRVSVNLNLQVCSPLCVP